MGVTGSASLSTTSSQMRKIALKRRNVLKDKPLSRASNSTQRNTTCSRATTQKMVKVSEEEREKQRIRSLNYYRANRDRINAQNRARYKKNIEKKRAHTLQKTETKSTQEREQGTMQTIRQKRKKRRVCVLARCTTQTRKSSARGPDKTESRTPSTLRKRTRSTTPRTKTDA